MDGQNDGHGRAMPHVEPISQTASVATDDAPTATAPSEEERLAQLGGHAPLVEIAQLALRHELKKLKRGMLALREAQSAEAVHDMRVALRSMRTTLRLLEETPGFPRQRLHRTRRRLRGLAQALGEVRDLDILLADVVAFQTASQATLQSNHADQPTLPASADGQPGDAADDLAPVIAELERRRTVAWEHLEHALSAQKTHDALHMVRAFAREQQDGSVETPPLLVRHVAGSAIWRRYEALLAEGDTLASGELTAEALHALRIRGKQVRYTLEAFEAPLGAKATPLLKALTELQNYIGTHHDTVAALDLLTPLRAAATGPGLLAAYMATREAQRDQLISGFPALWTRIGGLAFRQKLAGLIATL